MKAPVLNTPLTLQTRTRRPDDAGGYAEGWSDVATIWAAVDARASASGTSLRIIARNDIRPALHDRILSDGRSYTINAVADAQRGFLLCFAKEDT